MGLEGLGWRTNQRLCERGGKEEGQDPGQKRLDSQPGLDLLRAPSPPMDWVQEMGMCVCVCGVEESGQGLGCPFQAISRNGRFQGTLLPFTPYISYVLLDLHHQALECNTRYYIMSLLSD